MKLLYVNACVRKESRTNRIARALIAKRAPQADVEEVALGSARLVPLGEDRLDLRTALIEKEAWDHPMFAYARQFAEADAIVIAAPYWDGSFPAVLKIYLENIYVTGIVSRYGPDGRPQGLCRAKSLTYVTTAGGPYVGDYSYRYLQDLAKFCFGIPETELVKAEMLDVDGFDADAIVKETIANLN